MTGLRLWRKVEAQGEPTHSRNKHTAVVVGNKMLMFGGYSLQQRQFYNDITSFDFEKREWQELVVSGQPPSKRRAHSCVVIKDHLLVVFGGYNGDYCLNDVHTFNTKTNQWCRQECTGDAPAQRGGHTAVAWKDNMMVVHGGWDVGNVYYDCTYVLNTDTWQWEKLKTTSKYQPVGRVGHTSVLQNEDTLYIFGGYGTDGYWDDMNRLNLKTGEWEFVETEGYIRPCQRTFSTMEIVGNRILLFGGSNHDTEMNDVLVFDTDTQVWQEVECLGQIPEGRFAHVSCVYDHKLYFYGGIVRGSGELSGMYELTLEKFTADPSLQRLLRAWVIHSGAPYQEFASHLPHGVCQALQAYEAEVTRMKEMELKDPSQDPSFGFVTPAAVKKEEEYEEDEHDDDLFATEEAYEFESWDPAVEDVMRHMFGSGSALDDLMDVDDRHPENASAPIPECASSSSLASMNASSSSSQLGHSPTQAPPSYFQDASDGDDLLPTKPGCCPQDSNRLLDFDEDDEEDVAGARWYDAKRPRSSPADFNTQPLDQSPAMPPIPPNNAISRSLTETSLESLQAHTTLANGLSPGV